jgi:hypothetical protein
MFGVTPQGYVRKKYQDWLADLQTKARTSQFFGSDQDLSDVDPVGIVIKLMSYALDQQEQKAEDTYYALYPDTAEGVSLDRVIHIGGETRRPQQHATVVLRFFGSPDSPIGVDEIVATSQGLQFKTISTGIVAVDHVDIVAQCVTPGKIGIVPAGSITTMVTSITGITSVTNPEASRSGRDQASDVEAKYDYKTAKTGSGASIASLIRSLNLLNGVNFAFVNANEKDVTDEEGRPAHSIEVVIDGGNSTEIANVLWKHYVGLQYLGSNSVQITAENGQPFEMRWNVPADKAVYVDIVITAGTGWKAANLVLIKSAVIKYIGGIDTIIQGGVIIQNEYQGIGTGKDIHSHKIEAMIDVPGAKDVTASLSFSSPVTSGTRYLHCLAKDRPYTDNAKVNISVV